MYMYHCNIFTLFIKKKKKKKIVLILKVQFLVQLYYVVRGLRHTNECDYCAMNNIIPTHRAEPLDTKFVQHPHNII